MTVVCAFVAATVMTSKAATSMTNRDAMGRAATVMTDMSTTLMYATALTVRAAMARVVTTMTTREDPPYYPLVPDGAIAGAAQPAED
jgi:hypothetical protein